MKYILDKNFTASKALFVPIWNGTKYISRDCLRFLKSFFISIVRKRWRNKCFSKYCTCFRVWSEIIQYCIWYEKNCAQHEVSSPSEPLPWSKVWFLDYEFHQEDYVLYVLVLVRKNKKYQKNPPSRGFRDLKLILTKKKKKTFVLTLNCKSLRQFQEDPHQIRRISFAMTARHETKFWGQSTGCCLPFPLPHSVRRESR